MGGDKENSARLEKFHMEFCSHVQITFADYSAVLCYIPDTVSHRGTLPMLFLVCFSGGKIQASGSCPVITLLAVFFLLCTCTLCQPKFTYYCFHTDLIITSATYAKFYCIPFSWNNFSLHSSSMYLSAYHWTSESSLVSLRVRNAKFTWEHDIIVSKLLEV